MMSSWQLLFALFWRGPYPHLDTMGIVASAILEAKYCDLCWNYLTINGCQHIPCYLSQIEKQTPFVVAKNLLGGTLWNLCSAYCSSSSTIRCMSDEMLSSRDTLWLAVMLSCKTTPIFLWAISFSWCRLCRQSIFSGIKKYLLFVWIVLSDFQGQPSLMESGKCMEG